MKSAHDVNSNLYFANRRNGDAAFHALALRIRGSELNTEDLTTLSKMSIDGCYQLLSTMGFLEWARDSMVSIEHYPSPEALLLDSPVNALTEINEASKLVKLALKEISQLFIVDTGLSSFKHNMRYESHPMHTSYSPHPVTYCGVLFRSTLELRYALLFNNLGISWIFEEQAFQTKLNRYLPDFFLPDLDCFVEIKGKTPTEVEISKITDVCNDTGKVGVILAGYPNPNVIFDSPWSDGARYPRLGDTYIVVIFPGTEKVNTILEGSVTMWNDKLGKAFERQTYSIIAKAISNSVPEQTSILKDSDALAAKRNPYYFDFRRNFYSYSSTSENLSFIEILKKCFPMSLTKSKSVSD